MREHGAFRAPALFELFLDRIRATRYPSDRWIASAAVSARTTDQLDRLVEVLSRQQFQRHLSPRRLALFGMIAQRRAVLPAVQKLVQRDGDDDELSPTEVRAALRGVAEMRSQDTHLIA